MLTTAYLLSDTARLLRRTFDTRVRELGITSPQARLLLILSHAEGENQVFYAERLEVEPISLTRMIDRMAESGLLERRRDPTDRRAWRLHLTDHSRRQIDEIRKTLGGLEEEMLGGLDDEQRTVLAELLGSIRENLSNTLILQDVSNG